MIGMDPEYSPSNNTFENASPPKAEGGKIPVNRRRPTSPNAINTLGGNTEVRAGSYYEDLQEILEEIDATGSIKGKKI